MGKDEAYFSAGRVSSTVGEQRSMSFALLILEWSLVVIGTEPRLTPIRVILSVFQQG